MEELRKELEILEVIEATPLPPTPAPIPVEREDGTVNIPFSLLEYFKKYNAKIELDKNGRISAKKYDQLLRKYHVPVTHGIRIITFREVDPKGVRSKKML